MAASQTSSSDYYVSPSSEGDIKRSKLNFSEDEEALMIRMYNLVGERWSLIAGRIPGRTAEEIKSFWMTRFQRLREEEIEENCRSEIKIID